MTLPNSRSPVPPGRFLVARSGDAPFARVTGPGTVPNSRRASWARLLKKIFEVDPLLCPRCRVPLELVSVITEPKVVDRILAHRRKMPAQERELFRERDPPAETMTSHTSECWTHSWPAPPGSGTRVERNGRIV